MATQSSNGFPDNIDWSETNLTVKSLELINKDLTVDTLTANTIDVDNLNIAPLTNTETPSGSDLFFGRIYNLADGGTYRINDIASGSFLGDEMKISFRGSIIIGITEALGFIEDPIDLDPATNVVFTRGGGASVRVQLTSNATDGGISIAKIYISRASGTGNKQYIIERVSRVGYTTIE